MQYMLLIYHTEALKLGPSEESQMMQEYMAFTQDIVKTGKVKAGDRLQPTQRATTVQVRNGKTVTTDGPYAHTDEQLGGSYSGAGRAACIELQLPARRPRARHGAG